MYVSKPTLLIGLEHGIMYRTKNKKLIKLLTEMKL